MRLNQWFCWVLTILVCVAGVSTLSWATGGWQVWTEETARRQRLMAETPVMLNPQLELHDSSAVRLRTLGEEILILDFVFTRCPTVCLAMGESFERIQNTLAGQKIPPSRVRLLSISFDGEHDAPSQLAEYLSRFNADTSRWSAARVPSALHLNSLLEQLGVIVLPDQMFGFTHNAALYVIHHNRLVSISDHEDHEAVLSFVQKVLSDNS